MGSLTTTVSKKTKLTPKQVNAVLEATAKEIALEAAKFKTEVNVRNGGPLFNKFMARSTQEMIKLQIKDSKSKEEETFYKDHLKQLEVQYSL